MVCDWCGLRHLVLVSVSSFRFPLRRAVDLFGDWAVVHLLHDLSVRARCLRDHHDRATG